MKYETFSEYDPRHTALAESAFLTLWSTLGRWHSDLVLVGGLVPKYLCGDPMQQCSLPRPATLDVDLGIALAADSGQYGNLFWELSGQGFKTSAKHPPRLEKTIDDYPVYVDFLVEYPPRTSGSAQVEDITASIMPGVDRALATAREVSIRGVDLHGADQKLTARVCEVGPFLALKLRAFCDRTRSACISGAGGREAMSPARSSGSGRATSSLAAAAPISGSWPWRSSTASAPLMPWSFGPGRTRYCRSSCPSS